MAALKNDQVAKYESDGVLFPVPALSKSETEYFLARFHELLGALGDGVGPRHLGQSHLHFPWIYDLVRQPAILDIVQDVIGPDILVHSLTPFWKRPHDHTYVSWHQDGHYMTLDQPAFVSAWVALTESTAENGCMRVVPGSHRAGRLPHGETALSAKNLLSSGLEIAVNVDDDDGVDVVLRPGELSLHHVNIVHGSNPNDSGKWRIGFAIRYVAPHVKQKASHFPVVLARGEDRYQQYDHLAEPPAYSIEEGWARQQAFSKSLTERRLTEGRRG